MSNRGQVYRFCVNGSRGLSHYLGNCRRSGGACELLTREGLVGVSKRPRGEEELFGGDSYRSMQRSPVPASTLIRSRVRSLHEQLPSAAIGRNTGIGATVSRHFDQCAILNLRRVGDSDPLSVRSRQNGARE